MIQLDKWVITFVVFGVFVTGSLLVIGDLKSNYNPNMNTTDFNDTYETVDDMYDLSRDMENKTIGEEINDENVIDMIIKGAFLALKQIKNTFNIPDIFINAAITVMILAVIFALIYLFMRFA